MIAFEGRCSQFLLLLFGAVCFARDQVSLTICEHEQDELTCARNSVIIITEAVYGHLGVGKCVDFDTGHFGCNASVVDVIQPLCSGKESCKISEQADDIRERNPCRRGLDVFLQVHFMCVQASPASPCIENLVAHQPIIVTNGVHNDLCLDPYSFHFKVKQGQQMKLTMELMKPPADNTQLGEVVNRVTHERVPILVNSTYTLKKSTLLITNSNEISISLYQSVNPIFIIYVQATGCEDIHLTSADMWIRRDGDKTTIGCNDLQHTWTLHCKGLKWVGIIGNCSSKAAPVIAQSAQGSQARELALPNDIILVTIAASTIILGIFILTVGYVCYRRILHGFAPVSIDTVYNNIPNDNSEDTQFLARSNNNTLPPCTWRIPQQQGQRTTTLPRIPNSPDYAHCTLPPQLPRRNELISIDVLQ